MSRNGKQEPEPSVVSQKLADNVFPFRAAVPQPRQGRKIVAQGASPGGRSPHSVPQSGIPPLPRGRERGQGRGRVLLPTADAVGYPLSPRQVGADFINELLTQHTSFSLAPFLAFGISCPRLLIVGARPGCGWV